MSRRILVVVFLVLLYRSIVYLDVYARGRRDRFQQQQIPKPDAGPGCIDAGCLLAGDVGVCVCL